jgi:hypothetical protein
LPLELLRGAYLLGLSWGSTQAANLFLVDFILVGQSISELVLAQSGRLIFEKGGVGVETTFSQKIETAIAVRVG